MTASIPFDSPLDASDATTMQELIELAVRSAENRPGMERRRTVRYPYPQAIHLTPVDPKSRRPIGESRSVLGKRLSTEGFDFVSFQPFHFRFAIVSLEVGADQYVAALGEALWCKFSRHGWYETGGRFLAPADSPLAKTPSTDGGSE